MDPLLQEFCSDTTYKAWNNWIPKFPWPQSIENGATLSFLIVRVKNFGKKWLWKGNCEISFLPHVYRCSPNFISFDYADQKTKTFEERQKSILVLEWPLLIPLKINISKSQRRKFDLPSYSCTQKSWFYGYQNPVGISHSNHFSWLPLLFSGYVIILCVEK